jgi:hypothetical protein
MKRLLTLAGLVALSLLLFVGVFSVVQRPLVVGEIQKQLDHKLGYARTLDSPKIVIFAGSNGRYSHRCEVFSAVLGRPCVNASIGVGIGLDFQLEQWRPLLRADDLVYMPLEYGQYRFSRAEMHGGLQNALLVQHQRDHLWSLGSQRIAAAYGSFDLPFLIHALGEMALDRRGYRRRSSTDSLTPQGDESGHTASAGNAYAQFLRGAAPFDTAVPQTSDSIDVLAAFLRHAQRDGVSVIGGLPTIPDNAAPSAQTIERLRAIFEGQGQRFVALPNLSRYPLSCFFDTLSHLNEDCQKTHSAAVAAHIAASLARPSPP